MISFKLSDFRTHLLCDGSRLSALLQQGHEVEGTTATGAKPRIMNLLRVLADPLQVAKFQKFCGIEYEKPATCDQQTQTRGESSDSDSNSEQDERPSKSFKTNSVGFSSTTFDVAVSYGMTDTSMSINYKKSELVRRNIPSNILEERYNKKNLLPDNGCLIEDYSQKEQSRCMINKILKTNGYYIGGSCKEAYNDNVLLNDSNHQSEDTSFQKWANDSPVIESKTPNPNNTVIKRDLQSEDASFKRCDEDGLVSQSSENVMPSPPPSSTIRIKYKSLLYLAKFGAYLGNEEFYLTFFPFCVWNLDSILCRQVAMLWCVVMYLGQATKDYLRWPRPPWPPVVRLETYYLQEYSMPSTHAMAGTAIPLCLAIFMVQRYEVPMLVAGMVALLWFSVTCWSRLYLGVHTFLDLLVGFVYALLILFTFLGYIEEYDVYQQTHPFAVPVILFTALALCTVCYPSNYKDSSKGDAVQIVAALTGVGIGSWLGYHFGYLHESELAQPYTIAVPTLSWCGMALLRLAVGVIVLALLYAVTRVLSIRFYSYMYGLDSPDKTHPGVMTAYKFTTYTVVGTGISLFAPLAQLYLGIHRPNVFYEVL